MFSVNCTVYSMPCPLSVYKRCQLCPGEQGVEGKGWGQMEGGQGAVPAPPAGHGHTAQACSMGDAPYNDHTSDPL